MTRLSIDVQGFPRQGVLKAVEDHILDNINEQMIRLQQAMRTQAPKDLGDHSRGYRAEQFAFGSNGELAGAFVNEVPYSLYAERGRSPGKMPPVKALEGWARRRGINPYLVARKIGDEGTRRWQDNDNPLGIDRNSQPGNIKVNNDSIVLDYLNEGIEQANNFNY